MTDLKISWDGWRTYGDDWAWDYLLRQIRAGADRVGDARPETAEVRS